MNDESKFALLRDPTAPFSVQDAAPILAPFAGVIPAEFLQTLHRRPGVLLRDLTEKDALDAAAALGRADIPVQVVAESDMVEVPAPPRYPLKSAVLADDAFVVDVPRWTGRIPWDKFFLIDIVPEFVRKTGSMQLDPHESQLLAEANTDQTRIQPAARTSLTVYLELLCRDPLIRMRIDRNAFAFRKAGIPVVPSRETNFRTLVETLQERCVNAVIGPGMRQLLKGMNSTKESNYDRARFENLAAWMLTIQGVAP
ncbi:hypothetical protein LOC68_16995 [Blastopirellula sp. JC732]|uniref:Uncharacterized protein n=1 Tax=Blastopirellula sediminis TaxID=2894196 RepID=A0A9X1MPK2_9BACT|nr:hypothetical protein [Blastopirellula sediminis]MCC9606611.1 hypothetical protein [Blastopirellula sediminis]MCC9630092.1 hypothetical protein [Blastopirellula sediminis]